MLNLKRLGRLTAALLLCSVILTSVQPTAALQVSASEQSIPLGTLASSMNLGDIDLDSAERTVSIVHRTASLGGIVIGFLENGTIVKILETSGEFYQIDCHDMVGYIAISQISQNESGEHYVNCIPGSVETRKLPTLSNSEALSLREDIRTTAMQYIGVPYVTGGASPSGFDCSGFTKYVFNSHGYSLWGRTVVDQLQAGVIIAKDALQCGDLVFFENTTGAGRFASHIGIYIGNGQMIHAGNNGITIVSLDSAYYEYHYLCSRRVILSDLTAQTVSPSVGITQNINSSFWRENTQANEGLGSSFFKKYKKYC